MTTYAKGASAVVVQTQPGVLRGLLVGLIPLGLLVTVVGITVPLTALARQLFKGAGFFEQQQAAVIVLIVGLILAIAVFAVAVRRVLRQVAAWQQSGAKASATLWTLSATALIVVLPVALALLLPQHPAP